MSSSADNTATGVCCLLVFLIIGVVYLWMTYPVAAAVLFVGVVLVAIFLVYRWFQNKQAESRARSQALLAEQETMRQKMLFEQNQEAMGLVKFVDRYGNERWGTVEQVRLWQQEALEQERIDKGLLVREKETIIKEIVKVRCSYCGSLHEETDKKCPNCGATA